MSALDVQEGGAHYKRLGAYQPWEVLSKWMTPEELKGYAKGTVVAYLAREADKGGRLDIKKALHTLQLYLELSEEASPQQTLPFDLTCTHVVLPGVLCGSACDLSGRCEVHKNPFL